MQHTNVTVILVLDFLQYIPFFFFFYKGCQHGMLCLNTSTLKFRSCRQTRILHAEHLCTAPRWQLSSLSFTVWEFCLVLSIRRKKKRTLLDFWSIFLQHGCFHKSNPAKSMRFALQLFELCILSSLCLEVSGAAGFSFVSAAGGARPMKKAFLLAPVSVYYCDLCDVQQYIFFSLTFFSNTRSEIWTWFELEILDWNISVFI